LLSALFAIALAPVGGAQEAGSGSFPSPDIAPEIRDAELPMSARSGNFVAVPIPFSNPTLETGLIGAVGYFHAQTEAQERSQPASMTGFGAMYTSNQSYGVAVGHSGYWKEDRWRFKGALGYADIELPLLALGEGSDILEVAWLLKGSLLYSELSRRVGSHWYVGFSGRYLDIDQEFAIELQSLYFDAGSTLSTAGLGTSLTFDTRDMPTNAYEGRYFAVTALFNSASLGSDLSYASYGISFRSYHQLTPSIVLAWQLAGCAKSDSVPLWDACRIGLRGFSATDYLGKSSVLGQAELRWKLSPRWGLATFAGAGQITKSFTGLRDYDVIPSYGVGVRFTVDTSTRINMRLDYGRSTDSDAVYLSVGEAF